MRHYNSVSISTCYGYNPKIRGDGGVMPPRTCYTRQTPCHVHYCILGSSLAITTNTNNKINNIHNTVPYLVGLEHAVEPGEELLGAVVGVDHDGDAVELGHLAYVESHCHGASDRRLLLRLLVVDALARKKNGTAVGHLSRPIPIPSESDDEQTLHTSNRIYRG